MSYTYIFKNDFSQQKNYSLIKIIKIDDHTNIHFGHDVHNDGEE